MKLNMNTYTLIKICWETKCTSHFVALILASITPCKRHKALSGLGCKWCTVVIMHTCFSNVAGSPVFRMSFQLLQGLADAQGGRCDQVSYAWFDEPTLFWKFQRAEAWFCLYAKCCSTALNPNVNSLTQAICTYRSSMKSVTSWLTDVHVIQLPVVDCGQFGKRVLAS